MKQPKISVIIPVYNAQAYLRECLDSAVNQTMEDIEIICVDDGSTDASARLLRSFQDEDMRLRVLLREHCGAGPARNAGIEAADTIDVAFERRGVDTTCIAQFRFELIAATETVKGRDGRDGLHRRRRAHELQPLPESHVPAGIESVFR